MTKVWELWRDLEPYILQLLLGAIAISALAKDWGDYVDKFGRRKTLLLFAVTVAVVGLTLFETHSTRRETREKEQVAASKDVASTRQIEVLTEQVRLGRLENNTNSEGFRISFSALYDKYSELASQVKTAKLLQELRLTQKDLRDTELKLTQPKAALTASFWNDNLRPETISRETTASKNPDGSVTINVTVMNLSNVSALSGSYTIRLCKGCKFAKEPAGSTHFKGSADEDRQWEFGQVLANTTTEMKALEVIPPDLLHNRFEVDVLYSCVNCVPGRIPLWVNLR